MSNTTLESPLEEESSRKSLTNKVIEPQFLFPFILVTSLFALWGFANDITNPMVKAFAKIFLTGATEGTLVQMCFYGGYCAMAIPAAMFIRKFSYKTGILLGLGLYATGALLFIPSTNIGEFYPFLISYFILTCGLSFLETSANPYILSMGSPQTATRRLNFAQAFNPMGSLVGMFVAMNFIQARMDPASTEERQVLLDTNPDAYSTMKSSDLEILSSPYIIIGLVVIAMLLIMAFSNMPKHHDRNTKLNIGPTLKRLAANPRYYEGVLAQFFYVGAQIMCWTFIFHYATNLFTSQGIAESTAETMASKYNIAAMMIFCISRFICTFLLKYVSPGALLKSLALGGLILTVLVISLQNNLGLYCLVGISGCMSLMFPTIYGIALKGMQDDAKFAAAGLIMSIAGGSFLPMIQASIIDLGSFGPLPSVNASFVIPAICFVGIIIYGHRTVRKHDPDYDKAGGIPVAARES